jgi:hypothetical protein
MERKIRGNEKEEVPPMRYGDGRRSDARLFLPATLLLVKSAFSPSLPAAFPPLLSLLPPCHRFPLLFLKRCSRATQNTTPLNTIHSSSRTFPRPLRGRRARGR